MNITITEQDKKNLVKLAIVCLLLVLVVLVVTLISIMSTGYYYRNLGGSRCFDNDARNSFQLPQPRHQTQNVGADSKQTIYANIDPDDSATVTPVVVPIVTQVQVPVPVPVPVAVPVPVPVQAVLPTPVVEQPGYVTSEAPGYEQGYPEGVPYQAPNVVLFQLGFGGWHSMGRPAGNGWNGGSNSGRNYYYPGYHGPTAHFFYITPSYPRSFAGAFAGGYGQASARAFAGGGGGGGGHR